MATVNEIRNMIYNAERQRETYQRRVNYCEEQIRRLRAVYDELGEIKDEFRQTRKSTERIFEEKGKWRGRRRPRTLNALSKRRPGSCVERDPSVWYTDPSVWWIFSAIAENTGWNRSGSGLSTQGKGSRRTSCCCSASSEAERN